MNRYVYAPKDDPLHRTRWREPYSEEFAAPFRRAGRLRRAGRCRGSASRSRRGSRSATRRPTSAVALCEKLVAFRGARACASSGCVSTTCRAASRTPRIAPRSRSLAAAHVALAHEVRDALGPDATLWLVPTDYLGIDGDGLPRGARREARRRRSRSAGPAAPSARRRSSWRRRARAPRPCAGACCSGTTCPWRTGRCARCCTSDPTSAARRGLAEHASGVLLNPMQHARASLLTLRCAAALPDGSAALRRRGGLGRARSRASASGALEAFAPVRRARTASPR